MNNIFLRNVFLKSLRDNRFVTLWWTLAIILFNLVIMSVYPSFANGDQYVQMFQSFPPAFAKIFLGNLATMSGSVSYLNGELFSMFLPFLFLFFNMFYSTGAIADEEKSGSLDLLLSTPIPRWKLLLEKFATMVVMNLVIGTFSYISIMAGGIAVDAGLNPWDIGAVSLSLIGIGICFGGLAVALSAITGNKQISLGITGVIGIGTYMLNVLAPLANDLTHYQKLSPFYYYNHYNPIINGINWGDFSVLIILAIIFLLIGMIIFQKRDIVTN